MTKPETNWTAIAPGVMGLPTTKLLITYVAGSNQPFRITWDGSPIPNGVHPTLSDAQEAAERHMAELVAMGFEV